MPSRRILLLFVVLALAAGATWSAEVGGKWVAEFTTPNGQQREVAFDFEVDGETLTGTVSGRRGDRPIEDGKVVDGKVSFSVTRDFGMGEMKFHYEGTLSGEELPLTVTIEGRDRTFEMTARRADE
jgi:hypothetical protein